MKVDIFSPWGVALIAIFFAAIILSHVFAPPVVGTITSIVTTLVGAIFLERSTKKLPNEGEGQ